MSLDGRVFFAYNGSEDRKAKVCITYAQDSLARWERTKAALPAEDFELLQTAMSRQTGKRLRKLFFEGVPEKTKSHSEADYELCILLAKVFSRRKEKIDSVFRLSALYRKEKWEREDYSSATIERAMDACSPPISLSLPRPPKFVVQKGGAESVNANLLAHYFCEHNRVLPVQGGAGEPVRIYLWEGGCWQLKTDGQLKGMLREIIESYDEALVKDRLLNETCSLIRSVTKAIPQKLLDADESVINFRNGLLKLHPGGTPELLPHSPEVLSTLQLPLDWNPDALETPVFDSFLSTLCDGDEASRELILEFMGVCFSNVPGYRMKKALFLYGPGDTGKSQLRTLTEQILGEENCCAIGLSELEARFGVSAIFGKRLAGSADLSFLSIGELKIFKNLTGGDSVLCEFKHLAAFHYVFRGALWFCMNQLPKFGGDDGKWVYERMMVLECPNVIPKAQQDKSLLEKLMAEREGIVRKAVLALQNVVADGYRFHEPEKVKLARARYTAENNSVVGFKEECVCDRSEEPKESEEISWHDLYHRFYVPYCREYHRGYSKSIREFMRELAAQYNCTPAEMILHKRDGNVLADITVTDEARRIYGTLSSWPPQPCLP